MKDVITGKKVKHNEKARSISGKEKPRNKNMSWMPTRIIRI